jgi:hypothetical protein
MAPLAPIIGRYRQKVPEPGNHLYVPAQPGDEGLIQDIAERLRRPVRLVAHGLS